MGGREGCHYRPCGCHCVPACAPPASPSHAPPYVQHGWEVSNGRITFKPAADKDAAAAAAALPSLDIINHCLNYAREVERIV